MLYGTGAEWKETERYLNSLIAEYASIGLSRILGLQMTLLPLKRRLDEGERTAELYQSIMACE